MLSAVTYKDVMGGLSVLIALVAYGIYGWQTITGQVRPHPLSWLQFGVLTATGFWVQWDQGAGAGSWVMFISSFISFFLCLASVVKGERHFPLHEWAFLIAGVLVFLLYLLTKQATLSAIFATSVDVLAYGPTISRGWSQPHKDSATSFILNSVKFIPSLFAMQSVSVATCIYPFTLILMNAAVAILLFLRKRIVLKPPIRDFD